MVKKTYVKNCYSKRGDRYEKRNQFDERVSKIKKIGRK